MSSRLGHLVANARPSGGLSPLPQLLGLFQRVSVCGQLGSQGENTGEQRPLLNLSLGHVV